MEVTKQHASEQTCHRDKAKWRSERPIILQMYCSSERILAASAESTWESHRMVPVP